MIGQARAAGIAIEVDTSLLEDEILVTFPSVLGSLTQNLNPTTQTLHPSSRMRI